MPTGCRLGKQGFFDVSHRVVVGGPRCRGRGRFGPRITHASCTLLVGLETRRRDDSLPRRERFGLGRRRRPVRTAALRGASAREYYGTVGFARHPSAWILQPEESVRYAIRPSRHAASSYLTSLGPGSRLAAEAPGRSWQGASHPKRTQRLSARQFNRRPCQQGARRSRCRSRGK